MYEWKQRPIADLGDLIDRSIRLMCEYGMFEGSLTAITKESIEVEVGEGQVVAVERHVLDSDLTELYTLEVVE